MGVEVSGAKGRRYEREFAKLLEERGWKPEVTGFHQAGRDDKTDVLATIAGIPFHFEVKFRKAMLALLWEAIAQAKASAKDGAVPAAVMRTRRRPHLVVMELDDFLELVEKNGTS